MQRIAMLGSGFIGRFYAESLQGQRSKDKIVSIYSRRKKAQKNLRLIMSVNTGPHRWKKPSHTRMWM